MSPEMVAGVRGPGVVATREWTSLLACPRCRTPLADAAAARGCAHCGLGFSLEDNVVRWAAPPVASTPPRRGVGDYGRSIRYRLDPFASPYSPFAALTHRRTEGYYRRALIDDRPARAWAAHYLRSIDLPERAVVLDHGCGRGRVCAFLARLGHRVVGQDVASHPWWRRLGDVGFAVVPGDDVALPWRDGSLDLVVNSMVIGHLPPADLARHAREVYRCLKPRGSWVIAEANSLGFGTGLTRRFYGRLHALADVRRVARDAGHAEVDQWFEGVRSPVAPRLVAFLRAQLSWKGYDIVDHGSWLERVLPPVRRAMWVLVLRRPA